jgi:putative NIF3 family GTP cyclohydrolase 1 type 2
VGRVEEVTEDRLEIVVPRSRRPAVLAALRAAHSYEEPAFDVVGLATVEPARRAPGLGRIGQLASAVTLGEFCSLVADALPRTSAGVRAAGDPARLVRRVAVCGGSGGGLAPAAAAAGAEVLVTADGRHHSVLDSVLETGLALVDVAHWASEWPWLGAAARLLRDELAAAGMAVTTEVSTTVTDPWRLHRA